ncbi:MAG: AAA family ATPase [Nitrospirae bacterium]|nr:AAA family ATPase [Nitrospirota bacterium]
MKANQKIQSLYEAFVTHFYLGDETFQIGDKRYEPVALFGILNLILDGKELIFGGYGSGKTSSSERISSLIKGLPLEFVQATTIHGHPEQTEEKMKAVLDLGALEKEGKEVVKWKIIPYSPVVIIDEINRLPIGKQSMLLNEVDRNIWSYRGETLILERPKSFFATINYKDTGTTKLIAPLCDRFDLAVETGMLHSIRKRLIRRGIDEKLLRDSVLAEEMIEYILKHNETRQAPMVVQYINDRAEEFKEELEKRLKEIGFDIDIPREEEVKEIKEQIAALKVSEDAELFLDYIGQEIYCHYALKKDFSRCHGCHYSNYLCSDLFNISNRAEQSIFKYSKSLAWFLGEREVTLEHVMAIMPYALWHRSSLSDEKLGEVRELEKDSSDELYAVYELLRSVKRRWEEHRDYQIEAYLALKEGDYEKIKNVADKVGHPFFKSLVKGT